VSPVQPVSKKLYNVLHDDGLSIFMSNQIASLGRQTTWYQDTFKIKRATKCFQEKLEFFRYNVVGNLNFV
jgi:hypothetical protein